MIVPEIIALELRIAFSKFYGSGANDDNTVYLLKILNYLKSETNQKFGIKQTLNSKRTICNPQRTDATANKKFLSVNFGFKFFEF